MIDQSHKPRRNLNEHIVKCKAEAFKFKILKSIFCLEDSGGPTINRCASCLLRMQFLDQSQCAYLFLWQKPMLRKSVIMMSYCFNFAETFSVQILSVQRLIHDTYTLMLYLFYVVILDKLSVFLSGTISSKVVITAPARSSSI